MTRVKRIWLVVLAFITAGIVVSLICFRPSGSKAVETVRQTRTREKRMLRSRPREKYSDSRSAVAKVISKRKMPKSRMDAKPAFELFLDELSEPDKKLVLSVQDGLDEDDFDAVSEAAGTALKSDNSVVREAAIEALGWFGPQALPDLTPLMADPDEDVAQTAVSQWELALGEIEETETRVEIATAVMKTLANKEALETIVCEIVNQDDDFVILEALAGIIEGCDNPAGVEVAREEYERLTGEEWTGVEAANKWLDENYEPPTPDDVDDEEDGGNMGGRQ